MILEISKEDSSIALLRLLLIIFIEGFVTISVEMLTIRQLLPVVGNSVVVTSLIIGVFLLFLAYGYRRGGNQQNDYAKILSHNFMKAAVWLGIGLSYFFIAEFFYLCASKLNLAPLISLFCYLLFITAPLVYVLGQTVPITMNFFKQDLSTGALSGKVLHLSTLGSFLGSILTTLVFMNYLGVAWTIVINFILLSTLVVLVNVRWDWIFFVLFTCSAGVVYLLNIGVEERLFILTNNFANYRVQDNFTLPNEDKGKLLIINNSASSFVNNKKQGFYYIQTIKKILFDDLRLQNKDILVLGAGGFTLSAEKTNNNRFTFVDIDKRLFSLVKEHFLNSIRGSFIVADARNYVHETKNQYDVIVSDAYSNGVAIPAYLLTQEHFLNVRKHLRNIGYAIFNMVISPTLDDTYSRRIDSTLRSVFPSCMAIPEKYISSLANVIYVCKKSPYDADNTVYTDNRNTVTLDSFRG